LNDLEYPVAQISRSLNVEYLRNDTIYRHIIYTIVTFLRSRKWTAYCIPY